MNVIIVSGLSGSGKTVVLNTLEDLGYYCIDNMNPQILKDHIQDYIKYDKKLFDKIAFGIDIRTGLKSFEEIPYLQKEIEKLGYPLKTFFLKSSASSIIKRYNNTRRKHPLASAGLTLQESLDKERKAFSKVINEKIEIIDTSKTNIYQLRDIIINKVSKKVNLSIVSIKSFGYKFGIPEDADFIFDARCLRNPYWEKNLRNLNGKNKKIGNFFKKDKLPEELIKSITIFLKKWVKVFSKQNKNYISIAVGCTGGKHRSVYIAEKLGENFKKIKNYKVLIKHRDI